MTYTNPVIIVSAPVGDGDLFLDRCLTSIDQYTSGHQVVVIRTTGYEVGALREASKLGHDRFMYFQHTWEILSPEFWDKLPNTGSAYLGARPTMYTGIYEQGPLKAALDQWPNAATREDSIYMEIAFCDTYGAASGAGIIWPNFNDFDASKHWAWVGGRKNLVLENQYIRKFKGTSHGGPGDSRLELTEEESKILYG